MKMKKVKEKIKLLNSKRVIESKLKKGKLTKQDEEDCRLLKKYGVRPVKTN